MWRRSRDWLRSDARARPRPAAEVLEAWLDGDTIACLPAWKSLLRVLVADGDKDTTDSFSRLVKLWGHPVRVANDGAAALQTAAVYQPNVLLLDIALPKMDGCYLAQQLRRQKRFQDTLLIAITGYADEAHRQLGEEAGFDHYLPKPVEPSTLENLLLLEQDRLADAPETARVTSRKCGILVVDEEGQVRDVRHVALRHQGFAVWLAANGQEALDLYRRHHEIIDVVLLNVPRPGPDGPQTLVALQELSPRIRCCFLSGDLGSYAEWMLWQLGAASVLRKPLRPAQIAQVLWELAGKAQANPYSR